MDADLLQQLLRSDQWHEALPLLQWLQYAMWERHKVRAVRRTLAQVAQQGSLDVRGALSVAGQRIAVCYYRAGYAPTDYPSEQEWSARSGAPAFGHVAVQPGCMPLYAFARQHPCPVRGSHCMHGARQGLPWRCMLGAKPCSLAEAEVWCLHG